MRPNVIDPHKEDNRYVRRKGAKVTKSQDKVGRSLAIDSRKPANTKKTNATPAKATTTNMTKTNVDKGNVATGQPWKSMGRTSQDDARQDRPWLTEYILSLSSASETSTAPAVPDEKAESETEPLLPLELPAAPK